jgi:hypothetical protein
MRGHFLGDIRVLAGEIIDTLLPPIVPENQAGIAVALGCGEKKVVRPVMSRIFALDKARVGIGFSRRYVMTVGIFHSRAAFS